jgi:glutamate racemase
MESPIGFFDSGIGGLTVLKEAQKICPFEHFIYLADQARMPYGDKAPEIIQQYALDNSAFLLQKKIKLLVVACHTAASQSLDLLKTQIKVPIITILESALQVVINRAPKRLAILATEGTIRSGVFQHHFKNALPQTILYPIACPLFVPLIEQHAEPQIIEMTARTYLDPIKHEKIDTLLFACTHYPLIASIIQKIVGPEVELIDPALHCAQTLYKTLQEQNLLNSSKEENPLSFYTSLFQRNHIRYIKKSDLQKIRFCENICS